MPPFLASDAPPFNRGFRKIHDVATQTIRGGQAVNVASVDGTHYRIQLGYISNTVATAAGDGAGGTYTQTTQTPAFTHPAHGVPATDRHRPGLSYPGGKSASSWTARLRTLS